MNIIEKHNQKHDIVEITLREMGKMKQELFDELTKDHETMLNKFHEMSPSMVKMEVLDMLIQAGLVKID